MKTFKTYTFERYGNKKVGNGTCVREMFRHTEGERKEKILLTVKIKYKTFKRYEWQNVVQNGGGGAAIAEAVRSAVTRLLGARVRIPRRAWIFVPSICCVL
jgi:hypothetical protein